VISKLDVLSSLAEYAESANCVCPEIIEEGDIVIEEGRHPVVEAYCKDGGFVSNSFSSSKARFALITGPNMAGKSTYLRQIALIVLLAHIGAMVPARKATIPLADRIFCRVGASDNLSRGESTFLVEMSETAAILRSATRRSLVIMDEVGRGTSTQDGMSLAYAVMKYLAELGSITLFATHYHELTMLDTYGMQLLHMAVSEEKDSIVFLRKAVEGAARSSYGIHVAKLAGLPYQVIREASAFQKRHFEDYSSFDDTQGNLFTSAAQDTGNGDRIISMIEDFDTDRSSPMDALVFISKLKEML
ncbi:MAG: DNA mismatch repair protein MutS, partial [Candidatus Ornithospirochaeta sp.]|nr:DNA mismatch repair protein MutS [Candidatus Ornithospirochaeta sp.]